MVSLLWLLACVPHHPNDMGTTSTSAPSVWTPEAITVLTAGASDVDVSIRRDSLRALIQSSTEPAGGPWGARGRWDPNPYVQRATVEALAARNTDPAAQALLVEMVSSATDPFARGFAALALPVGAVPVSVLETEAAKFASWEGSALLLAATRAGSKPAQASLEELLKSGELPLELGFLRALGASGQVALAPALQEGLAKMEPELRISAAGSLLALDPEAARPIFLTALQSEDEDVLGEAVDRLSQIPGPAAESLLQQVHGRKDWVGALATGSLVSRGSLGWGPLRPLLKNADSEVRADAANAAAARWKRDLRGGEPLLPLLMGMLEEENLTERLAAIAALCAHGDKQTVAPFLRDESMKLRVAAAVGMVN